jgi:hypothetical protein
MSEKAAPVQNREKSPGLPLTPTKCCECGGVRFLAIGGEIPAPDLNRARWLSGHAELRHGGWLCYRCWSSNADRGLRDAAKEVQASHVRSRIEVVQGWGAR